MVVWYVREKYEERFKYFYDTDILTNRQSVKAHKNRKGTPKVTNVDLLRIIGLSDSENKYMYILYVKLLA